MISNIIKKVNIAKLIAKRSMTYAIYIPGTNWNTLNACCQKSQLQISDLSMIQ